MNYENIAKEILQSVGGIDNISFLTNCATRLRINFKNESKVDLEKVKKINGVIGAVNRGGEYQIIIGMDVVHVANAIKAQGTISSEPEKETGKHSFIQNLLNKLSGIFAPLIPLFVAGGMIKALIILLNVAHLLEKTSQTYVILNFMGDAAFYFLPILVAFSTAQTLHANPYIAAAIGAVLIHPNFVAMVAAGEPVHFLSVLPVQLVSYSSSVLPAILGVWFMSYVERFVEKVTPKVIRFMAKPLLTCLIVMPITLIFFGPIGNFLGSGLAGAISFLDVHASWLAPTIMGTFFPLLVLTGMHIGAFVPLLMQSYATFGHEAFYGPASFVSNICQGAASLAIAVKTKSKATRQLTISTGISALLGITEPALYGVTIKNKKVLFAVMAGGGIGGLYAGLNHVVRYAPGAPGLATFALFIGEDPMNIINAFISIGIGFAVTFLIVMFVKVDYEMGEKTVAAEPVPAALPHSIQVKSPVKGKAMPLSQVKDTTVSNEILGKGVAIQPETGELLCPVNGRVLNLFETKHAISIVDESGVEYLLHIGIDTVKLDGQYFEACVANNDEVKQGDVLIRFDLDKIVAAGYDPVVCMIVLNTQEFFEVKPMVEGPVETQTSVLEIG